MARKDDTPVFKQHQKVVAAHDLPGVPAGTPGKILLINGLAWVRYRVLFEGRIERGMLNADDLTTPQAWQAAAAERVAAERKATRDAERAARLAAMADGSVGCRSACSSATPAASRSRPTRWPSSRRPASTSCGWPRPTASTVRASWATSPPRTETRPDRVGHPADLHPHADAARHDRGRRRRAVRRALQLGLGASGPQVIEGWHGVPYDRPLGRTREIIEICRDGVGAARTARARRAATTRCRCRPRQGTGLGKPLKIIAHPVRAPDPDLGRVARPEERRDDRRGGRRLAAAVLPAREGQGRVGRRPRRGRGQARRPTSGRSQIAAGGLRRHRRRRQGAARLRPADGRPLRRRHGRQGQELLQRLWCAATATSRRPRRSRTSTSTARRTRLRPRSPTELLEAITLCGPEGYVKERIAAYGEAGVTHLQITPVPTGEQSVTSLVSKVKELSS